MTCMTSECHTDFDFASLTHPDPDEVSCTDCHQGDAEDHAVNNTRLTRSPDSCTYCHDGFLERPFPHAPVAEEKCTTCHNPHGDLQKMLLPPDYPSGMYVSYNEKEYRLCFSCHKRELLMFPDTSFSTDFRDGNRNLHYLHVNKTTRGRNCDVCHDIHGSNQPKMITEYMGFGNWKMKTNFKKTEIGGGCAPGCHRPKTYSRELQFMDQKK
jgi:predicted CXXCH cytochrome family protein